MYVQLPSIVHTHSMFLIMSVCGVSSPSPPADLVGAHYGIEHVRASSLPENVVERAAAISVMLEETARRRIALDKHPGHRNAEIRVSRQPLPRMGEPWLHCRAALHYAQTYMWW